MCCLMLHVIVWSGGDIMGIVKKIKIGEKDKEGE